MYTITYQGEEMKAHTEKEIRYFFRTNQVNAVIPWSLLRSENEVSSLYEEWYICKEDGGGLKEVNHLSSYAYIDVLIKI